MKLLRIVRKNTCHVSNVYCMLDLFNVVSHLIFMISFYFFLHFLRQGNRLREVKQLAQSQIPLTPKPLTPRGKASQVLQVASERSSLWLP